MGGCTSRTAARGPEQGEARTQRRGSAVWTSTLDNFEARLRYSYKDVQDDWAIHKSEVIGEGMSGSICTATNKLSDQVAAVKVLHKKMLDREAVEDLRAEVNNYLVVDHPHIARLLHVYESAETVSLIMEYCAGKELFDVLVAVTRFCEFEAQNICYQALLAIAYLHRHQLIHCDISLHNFMYSEDPGCLKLIDFGLCKKWDCHRELTRADGTLTYTAPEVFTGLSTRARDLWSLGVVTFLLLSGKSPFPMRSEEKAMAAIASARYTMKPEHWSGVSDIAKDFVNKLLVLKPDGRMSAGESLEHQWMQSLENDASMSPRGRRGTTKEEKSVVLHALSNYSYETHIKRAMMAMIANQLDSTVLDEVHTLFLMLDADKTGTITKANLTDFFHGELARDEIETLFVRIDVGHHGEICYSDFVAAMVESMVDLDEQKVRAAFEMFDKSRTGMITRADLEALVGPCGINVSVDTLIKECDCDPKLGISLEAFEDHLFSEHDITRINATRVKLKGMMDFARWRSRTRLPSRSTRMSPGTKQSDSGDEIRWPSPRHSPRRLSGKVTRDWRIQRKTPLGSQAEYKFGTESEDVPKQGVQDNPDRYTVCI